MFNCMTNSGYFLSPPFQCASWQFVKSNTIYLFITSLKDPAAWHGLMYYCMGVRLLAELSPDLTKGHIVQTWMGEVYGSIVLGEKKTLIFIM